MLNPGIFKYLEGNMDNGQLEREPMGQIAKDGELTAYRHKGFWKCMDALRDKIELEELWQNGNAPWKIW